MFKPQIPKIGAIKAPVMAAPMGEGGPMPKVRQPRHTLPRPRFHRAKMGGLGKSAYGPPNKKMAFNDPMAAGQPDQAFPAAMAGGGAPEPGAQDGGPEGPPVA